MAGCAAPTAAPVPPYSAPGTVAGDDTCGRTPLESLIGQPVARLPPTGGWQSLRIIHPGDAVTEDFSLTRLNVELDAAETIIRLSCG